MNLRRVVHILGLVLLILAAAQLLPIIWCWKGEESRALRGFLLTSGLTASLGVCLRLMGSKEGDLYRREGVLLVVGSWVLASITGAIPYYASGIVPNLVDALFESASGFTTTGASILTNIEGIGRPLLFWRSLTQWLGGIGIVVLFVALLSELGPGARFLFKLEVPGPKAEILHDRVQDTALALGRIYLGISAALAVILWACGLSVFDALTHTFSTVSTGGFSPHSESVGYFGPLVQTIILFFMLASGVNFSLYFIALQRRNFDALRDRELQIYLGLVLVSGLCIAIDRSASVGAGVEWFAPTGVGQSILDALFQVVSIVTTTGYATADFSNWPTLSQSVLLSLMVVGGCAGSTAGGAKVVRVMIGWRAILREVRLTFSPNSVIAVAIGGVSVPETSVRSVVALLVLWLLTWGVGTVLLSIGDHGITTAASASIATLSNVGPGLGPVGPAGHFAFFASWQKLVMVLLMWLGRLEFFALLSIFQLRFWRA